MLRFLRRAWQRYVLYRSRVPYPVWHRCVQAAPVLGALNHTEEHRLRQLTGLFLHEKRFTGAGGLTLNDDMCVLIAAQACLLILNLDLDYLDGWTEIIVYPDTFVVRREARDAAGVVHQESHALDGESWSRGPVILSWMNVMPGAQPHGPGSNVILHEFAHKLDMLNGPADGLPPLHHGMRQQTWATVLEAAYAHLGDAVRHHRHVDINPYAVTNPGEFFAVMTEVFFEQPAVLRSSYPDVYNQFTLFYLQDPIARMSTT